MTKLRENLEHKRLIWVGHAEADSLGVLAIIENKKSACTLPLRCGCLFWREALRHIGETTDGLWCSRIGFRLVVEVVGLSVNPYPLDGAALDRYGTVVA